MKFNFSKLNILKNGSHRAFTLAELMVMLLIVSVIMSATLPLLTSKKRGIVDAWENTFGGGVAFNNPNNKTSVVSIGEADVKSPAALGYPAMVVTMRTGNELVTRAIGEQSQVLFVNNNTMPTNPDLGQRLAMDRFRNVAIGHNTMSGVPAGLVNYRDVIAIGNGSVNNLGLGSANSIFLGSNLHRSAVNSTQTSDDIYLGALPIGVNEVDTRENVLINNSFVAGGTGSRNVLLCNPVTATPLAYDTSGLNDGQSNVMISSYATSKIAQVGNENFNVVIGEKIRVAGDNSVAIGRNIDNTTTNANPQNYGDNVSLGFDLNSTYRGTVAIGSDIGIRPAKNAHDMGNNVLIGKGILNNVRNVNHTSDNVVISPDHAAERDLQGTVLVNITNYYDEEVSPKTTTNSVEIGVYNVPLIDEATSDENNVVLGSYIAGRYDKATNNTIVGSSNLLQDFPSGDRTISNTVIVGSYVLANDEFYNIGDSVFVGHQIGRDSGSSVWNLGQTIVVGNNTMKANANYNGTSIFVGSNINATKVSSFNNNVVVGNNISFNGPSPSTSNLNINNAVVVGYGASLYANTNAEGSIVIGKGSLAYGNNAIVLGTGAGSSAKQGVSCIGFNNQCSYANSGDMEFVGPGWASGRTMYLYGSSVTRSNGSATFDTTSDIRLKNIKGFAKKGLAEIRKITIYNFTYKNNPDVPRVGVIAQEVMKIIPEAVSKAPNGYYNVNITPIFYVALNAIKQIDDYVQNFVDELDLTVKDLKFIKNKIKHMESKVAKLKKENAELKAKVKLMNSRISKLEK